MQLEPTDRTRHRRLPKRGSFDVALIHAVLDEALMCHVGFAVDGRPWVVPTIHARVDDDLYLHGAVANHMLGSIAGGVEACVTVGSQAPLLYALSILIVLKDVFTVIATVHHMVNRSRIFNPQLARHARRLPAPQKASSVNSED